MKVLSVAVLVGAAVVSAGAGWLGLSHLAYFLGDPMALAANVGLPLLLIVGFLLALRLRADLRLSLALSLLAGVVALYAAEWVVERQLHARVAARPNFDPRTKIQVIRDLRKRGIDAYPVMRAKSMLVDNGKGTLIPVLGGRMPALPLASLPDTTVVSCNEDGHWLVYPADGQGFHNPPDEWKAGPPEILLLGDSFAHGSCVRPDADMASDLRKRFHPVITLGVSGFGPLSMLAALKEYGEPLKPRTVVWAFFEGNDLTEDLPLERRSPLLRRYFEDPTFSQRLFQTRDDWAPRMRAYLDGKLEAAMARVDDPNDALMEFLQLYHLRERFGLGPVSIDVVPVNMDDQIAYFGRVLARAKALTASWGGRLILAYLPDSARFLAAAHDDEIRNHLHDAVLGLARGQGLPVVDLTRVFAAQPDPEALFVYPGSHYDAAGYAVAADAITRTLLRRTAANARTH